MMEIPTWLIEQSERISRYMDQHCLGHWEIGGIQKRASNPVADERAAVREALKGMQRWFGKWPEFVPADDKLSDAAQAVAAMNEAIKAADTRAALASAPVAGEAKPVTWLTKRHGVDEYEFADPHEKASNPKHWSDAFPVYRGG